MGAMKWEHGLNPGGYSYLSITSVLAAVNGTHTVLPVVFVLGTAKMFGMFSELWLWSFIAALSALAWVLFYGWWCGILHANGVGYLDVTRCCGGYEDESNCSIEIWGARGA